MIKIIISRVTSLDSVHLCSTLFWFYTGVQCESKTITLHLVGWNGVEMDEPQNYKQIKGEKNNVSGKSETK